MTAERVLECGRRGGVPGLPEQVPNPKRPLEIVAQYQLKVLLLLDNVWEHQHEMLLRTVALACNQTGSRVVVSTRHRDLLSSVNDITTFAHLPMGVLTKKEANQLVDVIIRVDRVRRFALACRVEGDLCRS